MSAPSAPMLDTVTYDGGPIALAWTAGATGGSPITTFKVYRGISSGAETLLATVPLAPLTYLDYDVVGSTEFFYKVTAVNAVGESVRSNEESAETPCFLVVEGAAGLNPADGDFTVGHKSGGGPSEWPTGERRASFDLLTVDATQKAQLMSARITQTGNSAQTEIYSFDLDVRPMPSALESDVG